MGDWRYVSEEDIASFGSKDKRVQAWSHDGWIGKQVRKWGITARVNGTVFFHAGLALNNSRANPNWSKYGIEGLRKMSAEALEKMTSEVSL